MPTSPPHPKRSKINDDPSDAAAAAAMTAADQNTTSGTVNNNAGNENILLDIHDDDDATLSGMSNKLTETILGFLGYKDIMKARICCRKFREAARNTLVPWAEYDYGKNSYTRSQCTDTQLCVNSVKRHKAMVAMSTALPNLQQLSVCTIWSPGIRGDADKYCDGEDPNEEHTAQTTGWKNHEIQMISEFKRLQHLKISSSYLNGRYPIFFNFPLLQKLSFEYCTYLKWDLKLLVGLPSLRELYVRSGGEMTGNIKNLSVLKNTLQKLSVCCHNSAIEGDLMDLSDFPLLKVLNLRHCSLVTGDVRDIGEDDFPMLIELDLGKGFVGSRFHKFQRIADAPSVMQAIHHRLKQRDPPLLSGSSWMTWSLSQESPEWYASNGERGHPSPPFFIDFVRVGSRNGWRWKCESTRNSCEINWIDPEPDRDSSNYDEDVRELQSIQEDIFCFEGYHEPPSQDDYKRLCEEFYGI